MQLIFGSRLCIHENFAYPYIQDILKTSMHVAIIPLFMDTYAFEEDESLQLAFIEPFLRIGYRHSHLHVITCLEDQLALISKCDVLFLIATESYMAKEVLEEIPQEQLKTMFSKKIVIAIDQAIPILATTYDDSILEMTCKGYGLYQGYRIVSGDIDDQQQVYSMIHQIETNGEPVIHIGKNGLLVCDGEQIEMAGDVQVYTINQLDDLYQMIQEY